VSTRKEEGGGEVIARAVSRERVSTGWSGGGSIGCSLVPQMAQSEMSTRNNDDWPGHRDSNGWGSAAVHICSGTSLLWHKSAVAQVCCGTSLLWHKSAVAQVCCGTSLLWQGRCSSNGGRRIVGGDVKRVVKLGEGYK
jgi:hypothetical protein